MRPWLTCVARSSASSPGSLREAGRSRRAALLQGPDQSLTAAGLPLLADVLRVCDRGGRAVRRRARLAHGYPPGAVMQPVRARRLRPRAAAGRPLDARLPRALLEFPARSPAHLGAG